MLFYEKKGSCNFIGLVKNEIAIAFIRKGARSCNFIGLIKNEIFTVFMRQREHVCLTLASESPWTESINYG